ncbi:cysteine desulfurase family protein [uncultured Clostridium sp.]|uniref:cysteine desulfurase family protein n=1 Tax=uncultured Clostridium sp. TaxID=59620 RepID=UPI0025E3F082|nr:aminotransferase class V-fold PLP-dependent enzyme [uncultured Clostridium sp.]
MAIKINKNLIYYSTFDPTKESKPVALRDLCHEIEERRIVLPVFQTYIRWTPEKSVSLLNFQLNGKAAVSPISINKIENKELAVPQLSFLTRELIKQDELVGKQSVNDGQQRLSCNYKAYIDHEDFKSIVLDITAGKFLINPQALKKSQIPVGKLYNKDDSVLDEYIANHKELQTLEVQRLLTKVRNKFMSYYYTVNYAKDLTENEQLEWFDVLNLAGSRVTGVEVQLTNMLVKGIDFYKEYSNKFVEKLAEGSLEHLIIRKDTEVSIPLAVLNPAYEIIKNKLHSSNCSPIPSDAKGIALSKLEPDELRKILSRPRDTIATCESTLVSVMLANNEIGTIQPIEELSEIAREYGAKFHTDAVQAVGHIPIDVKKMGVSMLSASAHKFNGPKGIGFLYSTGGIPNLIDGGAQEKGHRAGTENVAAIVGMAVALEKNCLEMKANTEKILGLEQLLINKLDASGLDYIRNGVNQLPGNISLSFANAEGEMLLHRMDLKKICISTGSACDSVNTQVSHVIKAIGVPEKYAKGTIRISLGKNNSEEEVLKIADTLIQILKG